MKKIVVVVACMFAVNSRAEFMPDVCYTAFNNPNFCWIPFDGIVAWTEYSNRSIGVSHYGAMESIIFRATTTRNSSDFFEILAGNVNNELIACQGEAGFQFGQVKKRDSLVKKLRKACGSKCKKIK